MTHENVIRAIFAEHNTKDEFGDFDDVGMQAEEALEKLAEEAA